MMTVSAFEFQKDFGRFKDIAQREPVTVTSNGCDSVVLVSAAEYAEYLKMKKQKYAYDGEVTEEFERDLSARMEKHKGVLEGLAK